MRGNGERNATGSRAINGVRHFFALLARPTDPTREVDALLGLSTPTDTRAAELAAQSTATDGPFADSQGPYEGPFHRSSEPHSGDNETAARYQGAVHTPGKWRNWHTQRT